MVEKLITLTVFKELPISLPGAGDDQSLVDELATTLSKLLQLCIAGTGRFAGDLMILKALLTYSALLPTGSDTLGRTLKTDFSKSSSKNAEALAMSILTLMEGVDDRAIKWIRSLIKQKKLHTCVEALLTYAAENGASHQDLSPVDPTFNSTEAGLLLNHKGDLVSTLMQVKTAPLKFSVDAPLPPQ